MPTKSGVYGLAIVESFDASLGGTVLRILCLACAEEQHVEPNTSISEYLFDHPKTFEIQCDNCGDLLYDADAELDGRNYDGEISDFGPPDSDPHEGDRDEYEPGGRYWNRDEDPEDDEPIESGSRHTIHGYTSGDGRVEAEHWTNDNLDRGYPNEMANWTQRYPSVESFRQHAGHTRQGIGTYVEVWLDGVKQWEPKEMARLERVDDLAGHISGELARLLAEFPGATYQEVAEAVARMNPEAPR